MKMTEVVSTYQGGIIVHRRYKTEQFEGYEFKTEVSMLVDEGNEVITDYFRYEKHTTGLQTVMVAEEDPESEGYYVYEDASFLFDIDQIDAECRKQHDEVEDESKEFIEFANSLDDTEVIIDFRN